MLSTSGAHACSRSSAITMSHACASALITGTAVLQCVEEGLLDLDAPAATYVPDIGELKVLDGFDAGGNPVLREPKRDITTRMLLLHTPGSATTSSTSRTTGSRRNMGSPA